MKFISRLFKRKKKKDNLEFKRDDILKSIPVRNSLIKWSEHEETKLISLTVPQKDVFWVRLISKVFMLPKSRVIALDEVGSMVWILCDGYNNIDTIIKTLCNKYKLTRKEAETSLLEYFRRLGKRGIIGFAIQKKR